MFILRWLRDATENDVKNLRIYTVQEEKKVFYYMFVGLSYPRNQAQMSPRNGNLFRKDGAQIGRPKILLMRSTDAAGAEGTLHDFESYWCEP